MVSVGIWAGFLRDDVDRCTSWRIIGYCSVRKMNCWRWWRCDIMRTPLWHDLLDGEILTWRQVIGFRDRKKDELIKNHKQQLIWLKLTMAKYNRVAARLSRANCNLANCCKFKEQADQLGKTEKPGGNSCLQRVIRAQDQTWVGPWSCPVLYRGFYCIHKTQVHFLTKNPPRLFFRNPFRWCWKIVGFLYSIWTWRPKQANRLLDRVTHFWVTGSSVKPV